MQALTFYYLVDCSVRLRYFAGMSSQQHHIAEEITQAEAETIVRTMAKLSILGRATGANLRQIAQDIYGVDIDNDETDGSIRQLCRDKLRGIKDSHV